ncbi:GNAT family N-acetyltransferase [Paracoccus xiamenensis]|uniref:GNAT family N-acetyltransferase n=1 Tax=Paracoccus xiamenensis TaxID=2714901 RepID=UPI0022A736E4|nr:GNAT family N-acetyltransferase [Paracoccus xiamenensis]NHF71745.1 GNAT family N-acetyltransferase [Paracoccus xiamenensis]
MQVRFRNIQKSDLKELRGWFSDAELSRRVAFPTDDWFDYVTVGRDSICWLALDGDTVIGKLQVDRDEKGGGYIDIAIRPDLRGKGVGAAVLAGFIEGPGADYVLLDARIEPDNLASLACFRRCGFDIRSTPDEDGMIPAIRQAS